MDEQSPLPLLLRYDDDNRPKRGYLRCETCAGMGFQATTAPIGERCFVRCGACLGVGQFYLNPV
jgi:DnaJ-class molecular chaperone